jgi:glutathione-regulated potassium-efflux system ancillary protein KefG
MGTSTLLVWAHPDAAASRAGAGLLRRARQVPHVLVHDLYLQYPDYAIDVPREQRLLEEHGTVVLQFPFQWYSVPPLLKKWLDDVLTEGWAYGRGATALHGKALRVAVTTGGPTASYQPDGYNRYTMTELLRPLQATAALCGMAFEQPFIVHGVRTLPDDLLETQAGWYGEVLERDAVPIVSAA